MLLSTGSFFNGSGGGGPPTPIGSYLGSPAAQTANSSSYTFTIDTGVADASRVTAVAILWENSTSVRSLSSATLGGNAMTMTDQALPASQGACAIVYIANPTGTTASLVVNFSGSALGCQVASYRIIPASATPVDHGSAASASPATITDIEVRPGGFLLVAAGGNANTNLAAVYNGTDTPVMDLPGTTRLESSACPIATWSVNTLQNSTTNDPGMSGPTNVTAVAASWL